MDSDKQSNGKNEPLSIIVIGASGDLAQRKIFPALFGLYCQHLLPDRFQIFGFARSQYSDEEFRERVSGDLTCRYVPGESCERYMQEFLSRCFYTSGRYDSSDSLLDLYQKMVAEENSRFVNRMFYLAIPPFIFLNVSHALANAGFVKCGPSDTGWSRAVIEKPFGRDSATSRELVDSMAKIFREEQTFRIDHYLGKEVIQNLLVLRFANLIFEPIWNRDYIECVQISFKENIGIGDRGGYFDEYGIIRDVMQNHLLQMLSLIAMEKPVSMTARHIRNEKVKVLRAVAPVQLQDLVVGQYEDGEKNGKKLPGYKEEKGVPEDSITPTYAATVLAVNNARWEGVPFQMQAGKGLDARMTEIRVRFRKIAKNIFADIAPDIPPNELVIRVQPDETIYLDVVNKVPGLRMTLREAPLDLRYAAKFEGPIPEAYESLILDVIRGDKSLFIREDELAAAWDIFTPVLRELEEKRVIPEPYSFGSAGPVKSAELASTFGTQWR